MECSDFAVLDSFTMVLSEDSIEKIVVPLWQQVWS